jgi:hypothetical protein
MVTSLWDVPAQKVKDAAAAVGQWVQEHPRTMGSVKMVGGGAETVAGVGALLAPEPTMATKVIGVAAIGHGSDTAVAGARQLWSGEQTRTGTSLVVQKGAEAVGVSKDKATAAGEITDAVFGVTLSFGAGALGSTAKAPGVIRAAQETATIAADNGSKVARLQLWWLKGAEADQAWQASSASEKFFYEIGQKTLSDADFAKFGTSATDFTGKVEQGRKLWEAQKLGALISSPRGLVLGAGKTLNTGPTPGARWLLTSGAGGMGTTGAVVHGVEASSSEAKKQQP